MCARHSDGSTDSQQANGDGDDRTAEGDGFEVVADPTQEGDGHEGWDCNSDDWEEQAEERIREYRPRLRLHQQIQAAITSILPRNETELEAHLYRSGDADLLFHKDFKDASRILMNAHHHSFIDLSWETIISLTPAVHHNREPYVPISESIEWFNRIMKHNGIDKSEFVRNTISVINRQASKKNCLLMQGKPNSGKTLVAESIAASTIYYESLSTFNGTSPFEFQAMLHKRCCLLNEPKITDKTIEIMKCILEGHAVSIDAKYKTGQTLKRTPIIIACNEDLTIYTSHRHSNDPAIKARCFAYTFFPFDSLKDCPGKLHPGMWKTLINELDAPPPPVTINALTLD